MAKSRKVQMQTARTFGGRISVMKEEGGGPGPKRHLGKTSRGRGISGGRGKRLERGRIPRHL